MMHDSNYETDLTPIRVETALSRYPLHRLSKSGEVAISIREGDVQWKVKHSPGPLGYRIDSLLVNRRLEQTGRPIPKLVRLGSLGEICRDLGMVEGGKIKADIKRALYENAAAFIMAKIVYRSVDGTERTVEFGTTRYAVIMTGETLPDGRRADAVYIMPTDLYREVLDTALTRPINYAYLRGLPPTSQRWYELASYAVFGAIKYSRPTARLGYVEFSLYAPQIRYVDWAWVRKQMARVHGPHLKSTYITDVEFEAKTAPDGRPDWMMHYTPGPKAKAEYRAFTKKGGPAVLEAEPVAPEPGPEPTGLERELIDRGVTASKARELVRDFPEDRIKAQIAHLDGRRRRIKDPGAWLTSAIRADFAAPKAIDPPGPPVAPVPVARSTKAMVDAYWRRLGPEERAEIDAAAWAQADPAIRAAIEGETRPSMKRLMMSAMRDEYLESIHGVPATG